MSVFRPDIPLTHRRPTDVYAEFDISGRPSGITIGSLPTAAWAVVLANRLSIRDVVFGEVVSGRNIGVAGADRIVGPTWQYVPFRVPFSEHPEWTGLDLLRFVQGQHVESSGFEGMGFAEIVGECTDWNKNEKGNGNGKGKGQGDKVEWFDSVVHQAPEMVESVELGGLEAKVEACYPHAEPLREWKCQSFVKEGGKKLRIEIVTFEEWRSVAEEVLREVGDVLGRLMGEKAGERVFGL